MADITQLLPPELLIQILCYVFIPDILRLKQVNRVIHDTILASPLIQHKIDLFLAGLEYNAAAGVDLIESRKAYLQYTGSSLDSLRPIEEKVVDVAQAEPGYPSSTVGGVHAVFADSVRLFSLGSASRGIPHKEWEIPSPIDDPIGRYIYPRANLIAFVERQTNTSGCIQIGIHLRALSDGGHHPAAQFPTIQYSRADSRQLFLHSISITGSRLAMHANLKLRRVLVFWDWKRAQLLFELEGERYNSAEFIDDYQLLVALAPTSGLPSSLVLIDTEDVGGTPKKTTFRLPPKFENFGGPYLRLERGVHEPSPEESQAPFYPDPAQRVIVLETLGDIRYLAISVGALLELKSRGGAEIGWDEWKGHAVVPRLLSSDEWTATLLVSGCRLFYISSTESDPDAQIRVYDFSARGCAQYSSEEANQAFGTLRYLSPTPARARIPWGFIDSSIGHDSVVFTRWDNGAGVPENQYVLQIWTF